MSSSIKLSPRSAAMGLVAIAAIAFGAGCTATVQTEPVYADADAEVAVDTVPVNVYTYPHEYYGGRTVYLVDGRWYYRSGPRWVTYRREPVELGRRRTFVEHRRPRVVEPAYRR